MWLPSGAAGQPDMWLTLAGIASKLASAYAAREAAATDAERIKADITIKQLEARQASIVNGGRLSAWVQVLWAVPFIIYTWKLVLWDKVLGMGVTDPLSADLANLQQIIVGAFFLTVAVDKIVRRG